MDTASLSFLNELIRMTAKGIRTIRLNIHPNTVERRLFICFFFYGSLTHASFGAIILSVASAISVVTIKINVDSALERP